MAPHRQHQRQHQLRLFVDRHGCVVVAAVKRWWQKTASHMGTIAQGWSLSSAGALYHRNYQLIHFAHVSATTRSSPAAAASAATVKL